MADPIPNPYVGPRSFEEADRLNFFGRDEEARQLTSLVISHRVVLFYAPSGAGKTSLLKAKVIPELKKRKRLQVLPVTRVGGDLLPGVDRTQVKNIYVLNALVNLAGKEAQSDKLAGVSLKDGLHTYMEGGAEGERLRPWLLILDQFEELFTTHPDRYEDRAAFFLQLQNCLAVYPQLSLLLSMREDYIASLDFYAGQMPDRLRTRFRMELLTSKYALEAVKEPAERAGRHFAKGVAEELVKNLCQIRVFGQKGTQAGQYVEPVQLQVVCYQLWEKLWKLKGPPKEQPGDEITAQDLYQSGNIDDVLADFYELVVAKVLQDKDIGVSEIDLRNWFERKLITEAGTRGSVCKGKNDTDGIPNTAVKILEDEHMLRGEMRAGAQWYELTLTLHKTSG